MKDFVCDICMAVWSVIGPAPTKCPHCGADQVQEFKTPTETTE